MEQFRDRLVNFRSPDDLEHLSRDLAALEFDDPALALPAFVVRSVLEGVSGRIGGRPLPTTTWEQVKDGLSGPLERVLDASQPGGDPAILNQSLTDLVLAWARTNRELIE